MSLFNNKYFHRKHIIKKLKIKIESILLHCDLITINYKFHLIDDCVYEVFMSWNRLWDVRWTFFM